MAPRDSTAIDPVRPCLVRWSIEAGQCDDRQSLTIGWGRESEFCVVPKYCRDNITRREGEGGTLR